MYLKWPVALLPASTSILQGLLTDQLDQIKVGRPIITATLTGPKHLPPKDPFDALPIPPHSTHDELLQDTAVLGVVLGGQDAGLQEGGCEVCEEFWQAPDRFLTAIRRVFHVLQGCRVHWVIGHHWEDLSPVASADPIQQLFKEERSNLQGSTLWALI